MGRVGGVAAAGPSLAAFTALQARVSAVEPLFVDDCASAVLPAGAAQSAGGHDAALRARTLPGGSRYTSPLVVAPGSLIYAECIIEPRTVTGVITDHVGICLQTGVDVAGGDVGFDIEALHRGDRYGILNDPNAARGGGVEAGATDQYGLDWDTTLTWRVLFAASLAGTVQGEIRAVGGIHEGAVLGALPYPARQVGMRTVRNWRGGPGDPVLPAGTSFRLRVLVGANRTARLLGVRLSALPLG